VGLHTIVCTIIAVCRRNTSLRRYTAATYYTSDLYTGRDKWFANTLDVPIFAFTLILHIKYIPPKWRTVTSVAPHANVASPIV